MKIWTALALSFALVACGGRTAPGHTPAGDTGGDGDEPAGGEQELVARIARPNGAVSILAASSLDLEAEFFLGASPVSPETVTWTSSLAGVLGSGNPLRGQSLAAGEHVISVAGALSGRSASAEVSITVSDMAVRITSPEDGARVRVGDAVRFVAEAAHQDAGGVTTLVSSAPAAAERLATFAWSSATGGAFGDGQADFTLSSLVAGTHVITVGVADDQAGGSGASGSASITLTVLPPNTPPTVTITSPASCPQTLERGSTMTLEGSVTDPDAADAALSGEWQDSISGLVTAGDSVVLPATTALGKHTLTFRAEDGQGESDEASCDVFVVEPGQAADALFPPTSEINDNLPAGNQDIAWIGADADGNTWIGTDAGLVVFDGEQSVKSGPYDGTDLATDPGNEVQVNDAAVAAGTAVIATDAGLASCDYAEGALANCTELANGDYEAVAVAADGSLVAAGRDGGLFLAIYDGETLVDADVFADGDSNLPSNRVRDVLIDGTTVYVATDDGLCIVTDVTAAFAEPDALCSTVLTSGNSLLPSDDVRALVLAGDALWLGTSEGLAWYDPQSGAMIIYDEAAGLPDSSVRALFLDAEGILWVGTSDGLSRFDPELGTFTNFTAADWGGTSDVVQSVFVDAAGVVWIGTDEGVFAYLGG